jgi:diadenosine tetraphosphate (Ap4A) HIT family hydrolase
MKHFTCHPTLDADTTLIAESELCECRLMHNAHFPWIILVPKVLDAVELEDLSQDQQHQLLTEIHKAGAALKAIAPCDKLNIATLGNQVSQLHIHVIARTKADAAWPNPVWGGPVKAYSESELAERLTQLRTTLAV